jgi:hypothetical protein
MEFDVLGSDPLAGHLACGKAGHREIVRHVRADFPA